MSPFQAETREPPRSLSTVPSRNDNRDLPGGPVVKNLPSNAGDMGSIPGRGIKIPHAVGQLSLCTTTRERKSRTLQLERSRHTATKDPACLNKEILCTATKTQCSQSINQSINQYWKKKTKRNDNETVY